MNNYIQRLHASIDHAMAVSYRRNLGGDNAKFVAWITLVKGTPFYGFFEGYKLYLKIYLFNPLHVTRLSDLLRQGSILKKFLQPYESHLQYLLQWMCDYNLYGCDYIDCSKVSFRSPVPDHDESDKAPHRWHKESIPAEFILDEAEMPRQSHCSLEVDVRVQDILNRKEVHPRPLHHDFVERLQPPSDEKLVYSMAGLWRDETRRRKAKMSDASVGSSPFPAEVLISMSAEPRSTGKGGWIHEDEYMSQVQAIIAEERPGANGHRITFDTFKKPSRLLDSVKSTLQSVEDLYPENLRVLATSRSGVNIDGSDGQVPNDSNVEVDESRIPDFDESQSCNDSNDSESDIATPQDIDEGPLRRGFVTTSETSGLLYDPLVASVIGKQATDRSLISGPGSGPINPAQMAEYGIRAGTLSQPDRDIFDVPVDYASDISRASTASKRRKRTKSRLLPSEKRRKLAHERDGMLPDGLAVNSHKTLTKSKNTNLMQYKTELAENQRLRTVESHSELEFQQAGKIPELHDETARQYTAGQSTNKALTSSFPVVKNPHDPDTIRRLSQHSSSSQKRVKATSPERRTTQTFSDSVGNTPTVLMTNSFETLDSSRSSGTVVHDVASKMQESFPSSAPSSCLIYMKEPPPTALFVTSTLETYGLMPVLYQEAYYKDEKDVPPRPREYAGREFRLGSKTVPFLSDFDAMDGGPAQGGIGLASSWDQLQKDFQRRRRLCTLRNWEIAEPPPSQNEVKAWSLKEHSPSTVSKKGFTKYGSQNNRNMSQIDGPTQKNHHGFKYSQKKRSTSVRIEAQYMSLMSLEVHADSRGDLLPNPEQDEVACIFWCYQADTGVQREPGDDAIADSGILALSREGGLSQNVARLLATHVEEQPTELDLITRMVDIVRMYDPDILTGYEVHKNSWGYIIERARCKYDYNICNEFSRMKSQSHSRFGKENDRWGFNHTSTIRVTGRHMINIWRAMRGELNLLQYTLENVAFHLLHRRIPHYSHKDLSAWFRSHKPRDIARVMDYYTTRVLVDLEILEKNELISRTSEQARLLGVDFFSVFSRGSQFKVESLMFRIAKAENYVLISPSRQQVGQQNALECLPLVMEPQSDFYTSPLLVLDFQSLYPSIMIAYNYCYSTLLGRVVSWRGQNKMGFTDYKREPRLLELLEEHINGGQSSSTMTYWLAK